LKVSDPGDAYRKAVEGDVVLPAGQVRCRNAPSMLGDLDGALGVVR
jgi:hypothetical protein